MEIRELLIKYARFNVWANERMLTWLEPLTDEQLDEFIENSFPSLRKTICHIWDAEALWHARFNGNSPTDWPSKAFSGDKKALFEAVLDSSRTLLAFVESKNEDWLAEKFEFQTLTAGASAANHFIAIHHVLNHSTYHRGQLVTMGRQIGLVKPLGTDFITWSRETSV
jgi:uncharacterized damage-inducible protein DinB